MNKTTPRVDPKYTWYPKYLRKYVVRDQGKWVLSEAGKKLKKEIALSSDLDIERNGNAYVWTNRKDREIN